MITVLRFVTALILLDKENMATALTAYVNEGPKVQYDAQAIGGQDMSDQPKAVNE